MICCPQREALSWLYANIEDRRRSPKVGSYTNYLMDNGLDKILKAFGEEAAEVIIAGKNKDDEELVYEVSDLLYHLLVLLVFRRISLEAIGKSCWAAPVCRATDSQAESFSSRDWTRRHLPHWEVFLHHLKKRWLPMVTVGVLAPHPGTLPTLAGAKNPVAPQAGVPARQGIGDGIFRGLAGGGLWMVAVQYRFVLIVAPAA